MNSTSTSRVLIRLLIHFAGWWFFWGYVLANESLAFLIAHLGWTISVITHVLVAPVELGVFYLRHGDWEWTRPLGVAGLFMSLALVAATVLALRYRRRWAVWSAHATVVAYWLVGAMLIVEGM